MTEERYINDMLSCLRAERDRRPDMQAEDVVKFIFQGMLGAGHLLKSRASVEAYIEREMSRQVPDPQEPLTEALSPGWCRMNLRRAMAEGLTPRLIANLMMSEHPDTAFTRQEVCRVCAEYGRESGMPGIADAAERLKDLQWLPSHSEAYRERYRPAYRVIPASWEVLLPVICRIARAAAGESRTLVTIDGPCASGKTTLAERLAAVFGAAVVHTDDFVISHARKTAERLAIPGGNCDWERLTAESLAPWKAGQEAFVRRYDCHADRLLPPEPIPGGNLLILEGSYSGLPAIRALADVRLFADTPESIRLKRLQQRESPESLKMFMERWIPLENAYFMAYGLPDGECWQVKCV